MAFERRQQLAAHRSISGRPPVSTRSLRTLCRLSQEEVGHQQHVHGLLRLRYGAYLLGHLGI